MNTPCTKLHLFVDGELSATEAEAFRHHLTRCPTCEPGLRDLLQLELLAARALGGASEEVAPAAELPETVIPLRARFQRAWRTAVPVALAASLAVVGFYRLSAPVEAPADLWLAGAQSRSLEARLSYPAADRYLSYNPMRGGPEQEKDKFPSLRSLADLEEQGDFRGIAAAYALRKDWKQAEAFLLREPASPDRDNDLAVLAMSQQRWDEALGLLSGALQKDSRHSQALWNRALVLREKGLPTQAIATFEQLAKQDGNAEWREAAGTAAAELRDLRDNEQKRWQARVLSAWTTLEQDGPKSLASLKQSPVVARAALYEAVRTATTRRQVDSLMGLARELDERGGGQVLEAYVREAAARDFSVRAPLARRYADLLRMSGTEDVVGTGKGDAVLEALAGSEEKDIYFGALVLTGQGWSTRRSSQGASAEAALAAMSSIVQGPKSDWASLSQDPWLHLLSKREQARYDFGHGSAPQAERDLLTARGTCVSQGQLPCSELN